MKAVSHEELVVILKLAYQKHVTPFVWGATGIGKSDTAREACRQIAKDLKLEYNEGGESTEKNFTIIDVRLSQYDPSDLRGLPTITQDCKTKWAYPSWLPTKGSGIVFLDEVNLAPPLVQSSAYQLVLDGRLGDYTVPKGWTIIAAGNRAEDKAYTFELAGPLCNRFVHLELGVPCIEDWTNWAIKSGVDSRIITFLNFKPSHLYRFDPKLKEKAFPTPRSWARYCSPMIEGIEDYSLLQTVMSAAVGEGVASEAVSYLKLSKAINLKELLENPEQVKKIDKIDVKYSLVSALAEACRKNTKETLPKVCKCAENLDPEFAILTFRFINQNVKDLMTYIQKDKTVAETLKKYTKYIMAD